MDASIINFDERMDTAKESPLFYKVFGLVGAGLILDSADVYMASNINSALVAHHFATLTQGSLFLSAGFFGLFAGSMIAGYFGDHFGRRKAFQWNLLVFGLATLISTMAPNIGTLIVLRFIAATGLGAETVTGFSMISEFAPVLKRGKWSGLISVIANFGAPLGFLLSTLLITHYSWRAMFFVIGIFALALWIGRRHLPESPRWLKVQDRHEEAEEILGQLETNGHYDAQKIENNSAKKISPNRGILIATVAVSAALLCQYMFTSWVPTLLVKQGINIVHSMWFSTIMMAGAPLGAMIGMLLVDRIGRKFTIVPGFILTAIAGIAYSMERTATGILINGFILTAIMYVLIASILSVYASELFSTEFRFRGTGFANGVAKLLTALSPYLVVKIVTIYGPTLLFIMITAIALFAAIIIGFFGPETKKQSIG
ncbi:MFS transporter [Fructobacillus ficulneus]|uniref:Transporter, major facilitator family protein n=1 Tax=Fructobacillus ficulneus TaxID=157463 RepID=A0A0K8MG20_9LACO|nr:MFS transporter [Fructobacillus ficulneus]GAO99466.1 transporter, major facilitator family protein [Fructobacillus ficulneus]